MNKEEAKARLDELLSQARVSKKVSKIEAEELLKLHNQCHYSELNYQPEQPSSYLDIFLRKQMKTKVKTMHDFIQLTKRVIVHMGSKNSINVSHLSSVVDNMLSGYINFKNNKFQSLGYIIVFYMLLRVLSSVIDNYLIECKKKVWFGWYSCSDLRLFKYLTSDDQKCGLVDAKLLGMIYKTISTGKDHSNYYDNVMYYIDLSHQKGLDWSGLEFSDGYQRHVGPLLEAIKTTQPLTKNMK